MNILCVSPVSLIFCYINDVKAWKTFMRDATTIRTVRCAHRDAVGERRSGQKKKLCNAVNDGRSVFEYNSSIRISFYFASTFNPLDIRPAARPNECPSTFRCSELISVFPCTDAEAKHTILRCNSFLEHKKLCVSSTKWLHGCMAGLLAGNQN